MRLFGGWLARRIATVVIFVAIAPLLFMLIDMAFEQLSQDAGLSVRRMAEWIVEDGFFLPRAVYAIGAVPAFAAGALVARRDAKGGATLVFVLALSAAFGSVVGFALARNLFLFPPPPVADQFMIAARATTSVVATGLVCYALSRISRRRSPREAR